MALQVETRAATLAQTESSVNFLNCVYGWMTGGLALTGVVAWVLMGLLHSGDFTLTKGLFYGLLIGEFLLVLGLGALASRLPTALMALGFLTYATLNGITLSVVLAVYTATSVATAFYCCAGMFGAMTVYGLVTKRDLTRLGSLCLMALIGLILAGLVNLFLRNSLMELVVSAIGVLVFVGLTAYDTQKLKELHQNGTATGNLAILGALTLYLDFINLFLNLLRLLGKRR